MQMENNPPYDFKGGSVVFANPFDTTQVADGEHNIKARIIFDPPVGLGTFVTATFTVDNGTPALCFDPAEDNVEREIDGPVLDREATLDTTDGSSPGLSIVADDGGDGWLSLVLFTGLDETVEYTVDPSGLPSGNYTGTITATAAGYLPGVLTINLLIPHMMSMREV